MMNHKPIKKSSWGFVSTLQIKKETESNQFFSKLKDDLTLKQSDQILREEKEPEDHDKKLKMG
jgi:hypothetical protein